MAAVEDNGVLNGSSVSAEMRVKNSLESILVGFRSLECVCCQQHVAFQSRTDPKLFICSTNCYSGFQMPTKVSHSPQAANSTIPSNKTSTIGENSEDIKQRSNQDTGISTSARLLYYSGAREEENIHGSGFQSSQKVSCSPVRGAYSRSYRGGFRGSGNGGSRNVGSRISKNFSNGATELTKASASANNDAIRNQSFATPPVTLSSKSNSTPNPRNMEQSQHVSAKTGVNLMISKNSDESVNDLPLQQAKIPNPSVVTLKSQSGIPGSSAALSEPKILMKFPATTPFDHGNARSGDLQDFVSTLKSLPEMTKAMAVQQHGCNSSTGEKISSIQDEKQFPNRKEESQAKQSNVQESKSKSYGWKSTESPYGSSIQRVLIPRDSANHKGETKSSALSLTNGSHRYNFYEQQQQEDRKEPTKISIPFDIHVPLPASISSDELSTQHFFAQDLKLSENIKSGEPCRIKYIWKPNPNHLSLAAEKDSGSQRELSVEVNGYWKHARPLNGLPLQNEILLTFFGGQHYRCQVLQVAPHTKDVTVNLFDRDRRAIVKVAECRYPSEALVKNYPVYTVEYRVKGKFSSKLAKGNFSKLLTAARDLTFIPGIESRTSLPWTGTLQVQENGKDWITFVQDQFRSPPNDKNSPKAKTKSVGNQQRGSPPASPNSAEFLEEFKIRDLSCQLFARNALLSPSLTDEAAVTVQFMWNYRELKLTAKEDLPKLEELAKAIEKHVEMGQPMVRRPAFDEIILAPYEGTYYRARVKSLNEDQVSVEFVDYGDDMTVGLEDLRELSEEICEHPVYGVTWVMPEIPEEVNQLTIDQLTSVENAQIELDRVVEGIWSGRLWLSREETWNDVAMNALRSTGSRIRQQVIKRTFNPWSHEILDVLRTRRLSDSPESLDRILESLFGQDYLIRFSQLSFPKVMKQVEDFQLTAKLRDEPVDTVWSDLFQSFYYDEKAVPLVKIPVGMKIHVKITYFTDLNRWHGYVVDDPWHTYRKRLCDMLKDYCEAVEPPEEFHMESGQLCLVRAPHWDEMDRLMGKVCGRLEKWKPKLFRRTDWKEEENWQAGRWFRGVVLEDGGTLESVRLWLLDVSREVVVSIKSVLPAVYRFVGIPSLGLSGSLLLQHFEGLKPQEQKTKWYELFPRGTIVPCTVVGHDKDHTIVKLPPDIESMFNDQYRRRPIIAVGTETIQSNENEAGSQFGAPCPS